MLETAWLKLQLFLATGRRSRLCVTDWPSVVGDADPPDVVASVLPRFRDEAAAAIRAALPLDDDAEFGVNTHRDWYDLRVPIAAPPARR